MCIHIQKKKKYICIYIHIYVCNMCIHNICVCIHIFKGLTRVRLPHLLVRGEAQGWRVRLLACAAVVSRRCSWPKNSLSFDVYIYQIMFTSFVYGDPHLLGCPAVQLVQSFLLCKFNSSFHLQRIWPTCYVGHKRFLFNLPSLVGPSHAQFHTLVWLKSCNRLVTLILLCCKARTSCFVVCGFGHTSDFDLEYRLPAQAILCNWSCPRTCNEWNCWAIAAD